MRLACLHTASSPYHREILRGLTHTVDASIGQIETAIEKVSVVVD